MSQIKILGIGGSYNRHSSSIAAMNVVLAGARQAGAETESLNVRSLALPLYEYGVTPPEVEAFIAKVRQARGLVWCTPLYHGSMSGAFKNTLDWLQLLSGDDPPYLTGKVVALLATAGGEQALQAVNSMEYVVRALRGWTLPLTAPISRADEAFESDGTPSEDGLAERLQTIGLELVRATKNLAP